MAITRILVLATALALVLVGCGGKAHQVLFQTPTASGPNPFTKPADVRGKSTVKVGAGPFGGTGSNLTCDRELLIRSLAARPDRLAAWARVAGIAPNVSAVTRYIRSLRPATLTRDVRVTNHSFANGRAVPYQAILQAGTAVLVDGSGRPVARCRCGNPLKPPVVTHGAKCVGCPPHYQLPPCNPPGRCSAPYPAPPPTAGPSGRATASPKGTRVKLGQALTLHSAGEAVKVTVLRVVDPIPVGGSGFLLNPGERYVGVFLRLENLGSTLYKSSGSDDAQLITTSNHGASYGTTYAGDGAECNDATSKARNIQLPPGAIATGCLPFILKPGEKAKALQYALDLGFGKEKGLWSLGP